MLCSLNFLPNATRDLQPLAPSPSALPRPRRSCACNGGCGPARAAPARSRSRAPRRAAGCDAGMRTSFELDLHMAVRRVVIAVDGERPLDRHAGASSGISTIDCWRCLSARRVGLAHHDRDLAARIARARRPPFAAVDHIIVAVAARSRTGCWSRPTRRPPARSSGRRSGSRRSSAAAATPPSARASRSGGAPPCCRCRAPSS